MITAASVEAEMAAEKVSEEQRELMGRFIFDPEKIQRKVAFAQFLVDEHRLGFGTFLTGWRDVLNKKGEVTGREQAEFPVIITSDGQLHAIEGRKCDSLRMRFLSVPGEMSSRWNLEKIKEFLKGKTPKIDGKSLFSQIRGAYEEFVYMRPEWYSVHALWDMGTYFAQLFHAYPYLELRGPKSSGKSKTMALSSCLTFNATEILTSPTEATLFHETDAKRPTTYLDEAENLFQKVKGKVVHDGRVEVINSGYSCIGTVPRMEQQGKKWIRVYYKVYSPKMIASINGLHGATESRAIVRTMTRALDSDKRGESEIEQVSPRWQALRNDLHVFMMQCWRAVLDQYNAFVKDNPTGLKKRDFQLWRPLLALAKVIGEDIYAAVLVTAKRLQDVNKAEEYGEGSWEYHLLKYAYELMRGGQRVVLYKELREALPGDETLTLSAVRRVMDGLGFRDYKGAHTRDGNGYEIPLDELEKVIQTYAPSINIFTSSQSSQEEGFIVEEIEEEAVKKCEDVKNPCEEMKNVKDVKQFRRLNIFSKADLLETLAKFKEAQSCEDLEALYPGEPVEEWLRELREEGEVYERPAGYYGVLR